MQYSVRCRDAANDAIEDTAGASPTLEIRTGAPPVNCAAADTGTVLSTIVLPADWLAASANGVKTILGTWQDAAADAAGTAGHFRIKGAGSVVDIQGDITITAGGGDMELQNTSIQVGQQITITAFTNTMGGA